MTPLYHKTHTSQVPPEPTSPTTTHPKASSYHLRLRIPGERFEDGVERPPEEPVEQDRPEPRDDSDTDRKKHETELRREPGQLPRKPLPKLFDDFHGVIEFLPTGWAPTPGHPELPA